MKPGWIFICSFLLAAGGFLLPFWPLSAAGILILSSTGRWLSAVLIGLLLDVAWGVPGGVLHFVYVPFTLLALLAVLVRLVLQRYWFEKSPELLR